MGTRVGFLCRPVWGSPPPAAASWAALGASRAAATGSFDSEHVFCSVYVYIHIELDYIYVRHTHIYICMYVHAHLSLSLCLSLSLSFCHSFFRSFFISFSLCLSLSLSLSLFVLGREFQYGGSSQSIDKGPEEDIRWYEAERAEVRFTWAAGQSSYCPEADLCCLLVPGWGAFQVFLAAILTENRRNQRTQSTSPAKDAELPNRWQLQLYRGL